LGVKQFGILAVRGRLARMRGLAGTDGDTSDDAAIEVEIDGASIDTGFAIRDEHLRSADFLNVAHFPTISFRHLRPQHDGRTSRT